jgi:hypothetical protein
MPKSRPTKPKARRILVAAALLTLLFVFSYRAMLDATPSTIAVSMLYVLSVALLWSGVRLYEHAGRGKP